MISRNILGAALLSGSLFSFGCNNYQEIPSKEFKGKVIAEFYFEKNRYEELRLRYNSRYVIMLDTKYGLKDIAFFDNNNVNVDSLGDVISKGDSVSLGQVDERLLTFQAYKCGADRMRVIN